MAKVSEITSFQYLCNVSRKKGGTKLIFHMQINIKISQKLILLNLMGMLSDTQNTRNNKFAKLWQHLKKEVWDEVDFLYI